MSSRSIGAPRLSAQQGALHFFARAPPSFAAHTPLRWQVPAIAPAWQTSAHNAPLRFVSYHQVKQTFWGVYRFAELLRNSLQIQNYYCSANLVFARVSGKTPTLAAATLSRLVFFTRYMASSARCSRPSFDLESTG